MYQRVNLWADKGKQPRLITKLACVYIKFPALQRQALFSCSLSFAKDILARRWALSDLFDSICLRAWETARDTLTES